MSDYFFITINYCKHIVEGGAFNHSRNKNQQLILLYNTKSFNPREPWATPVLHDIKLVIKWILCKLA